MPVPLSKIRELLLPGLWQVGSMGSSGALYPPFGPTCEECGKLPRYKWHVKWLCGPCYASKALGTAAEVNAMPEPAFTLEELEASKDLITNLSNR